MSLELMFVQFPHPGVEHQPRGSEMGWNRGPHARKFLKAEGRFLVDGMVATGEVTFWGEWEPQSRVVETYERTARGMPRWLHEPYWEVPPHRSLLQNTDPLVFGDRFLYSNCRQQRNAKLRSLAAGSIVAFGSRLGDDFVLDSVMVVGPQSMAFRPDAAQQISREPWVRAVVFDPLSFGHPTERWPYRAYWGATYDDDPAGPFSFVPCMPYAPGSSAFARPAIRLAPRWLRPKLAMGAKATPATRSELREIWDDIVQQVVERDGLALGLNLAPPASQGSSSLLSSASN